jgi:putative transposase
LGLRTIHLKLHNPSTIKRTILNSAVSNYNNAYNYLLKKAFEDLENIEQNFKSSKGTYSAMALSKWVDKDMSSEINKFDIQPFKDSLKLDLGITLASYFAQKKLNSEAQFPAFKTGEAMDNDKLRPIYFCRYDIKRCFCFLYDEINNKYFAKLFVLNCKNAKVRKVHTGSRELRYISGKDQRVRSLKKETFVIIPLSFGKWQESMLRLAVEKPEILRTAHLIMKGQDYYISLSIDLPEDEKISPVTYMGISRGIEKAVNYTVVDMNGGILESGFFETKLDMSQKNIKNDICILANKLVDVAVKNKSSVILQNLMGMGDKLSWSEENVNYKPVLGCKCYNELVRVLEYKLPQKGLPEPVKVSSVDIFHRCGLCGSNTKKNRFSRTMFICTTCGATYKLDTLGSANLAAKLIKYENTPLKLKAEKTSEGMFLQNNIIGLNLFVPNDQNPFELLKEEIMEMARRNTWNENASSLVAKLIKRNFNNIEII